MTVCDEEAAFGDRSTYWICSQGGQTNHPNIIQNKGFLMHSPYELFKVIKTVKFYFYYNCSPVKY